MNLVGTGTSVKSPSITDSCSLKKQEMGLSKILSSPTKILEVSAPGGSFFMKCVFIYKQAKSLNLFFQFITWEIYNFKIPSKTFTCLNIVTNLLNYTAIFKSLRAYITLHSIAMIFFGSTSFI